MAAATHDQSPANESTHERIDQAADGVKHAAGRGAARAEQSVEQATDAAANAAHHAADKAADWRERGNAATDDLRDRASDWLESARDYVRNKPVESIAIALAAGWLIGRLLSSRH